MPFPFKKALIVQAVFNEGSSMEISILTNLLDWLMLV